VFSGTASIRSGADTFTVMPGHVVFIPPMVPHGISNEGAEELVIMEIYAPAGADFQEVDQ
jgi:mannose-6-phosphate isomerase-like protein (cupin superfamily)